MNINKVRRHKSRKYVTISNEVMKDKEVSLKAKGLYAVVMSLPDDWDFSLKGLCSIIKEEYTAVNSAVKELISAGFCKRERIKEGGKYVGCNYDFYEEKQVSPRLDFLNVENPNVENLNDNINNSSINTPIEEKKEEKGNINISKKTKENILSDEEKSYIKSMRERYPRVMSMDKPLTLEQAKKLKENYDEDLIRKVLDSMENWKQLLKKNVSAYLTIRDWCNRENDKV